MSRYPTHRDAILANDDDLFEVPGSTHTMQLSILDGGPNDHGFVSLIPQANVIQAAHYGNLGRPATPPAKLAWGAILHVQGFGCLKLVQGERDWPKLVPLDGDRFYARYAGGPGYLHWSIRDRDADGATVPHATVSEAAALLFPADPHINTRAAAFAVAAFLSATAE